MSTSQQSPTFSEYEINRNAQPRADVNFPQILSPYIRTGATDVFGQILNHQHMSKCAPFELNMMECMEAYGLDKGRVKCSDLIEDFNECKDKTKQMLRVKVCSIEYDFIRFMMIDINLN